jgi:hypothetical protein
VVPTAIDPYEHPAARAPEVPVARVVIDPHEDPKSLRLKATQEGDRMGKCFKERNEAKARNEHQRAKELTHRGEAHRVNKMLLDKEASAKIFQGTKSIKGTCRIQEAYSDSCLTQRIIKSVVFFSGAALSDLFQNRRNEVDLHGLYVAEARSYFDNFVQGARDRDESSLRVIVGKTH